MLKIQNKEHKKHLSPTQSQVYRKPHAAFDIVTDGLIVSRTEFFRDSAEEWVSKEVLAYTQHSTALDAMTYGLAFVGTSPDQLEFCGTPREAVTAFFAGCGFAP
jgi:hypothetical protein